jgi:hypothetical protein
MTSTTEPAAPSKFVLSLNEQDLVLLPSTCSSNSVSLSNSSIQFESPHFFDKLSSDINKLNLLDKENSNSNKNEQQQTNTNQSDTCITGKVDERDLMDTSTKYGELIVLGYNGCIGVGSSSSNDPPRSNLAGYNNNNSNINSMSRRKSKYIIKSRDKPNGVRPATQHIVQSSQEAEVCLDFFYFNSAGLIIWLTGKDVKPKYYHNHSKVVRNQVR